MTVQPVPVRQQARCQVEDTGGITVTSTGALTAPLGSASRNDGVAGQTGHGQGHVPAAVGHPAGRLPPARSPGGDARTAGPGLRPRARLPAASRPDRTAFPSAGIWACAALRTRVRGGTGPGLARRARASGRRGSRRRGSRRPGRRRPASRRRGRARARKTQTDREDPARPGWAIGHADAAQHAVGDVLDRAGRAAAYAAEIPPASTIAAAAVLIETANRAGAGGGGWSLNISSAACRAASSAAVPSAVRARTGPRARDRRLGHVRNDPRSLIHLLQRPDAWVRRQGPQTAVQAMRTAPG